MRSHISLYRCLSCVLYLVCLMSIPCVLTSSFIGAFIGSDTMTVNYSLREKLPDYMVCVCVDMYVCVFVGVMCDVWVCTES